MKLENTKKSIIRTVKLAKNENHLNISISRILAERLLTNNDYDVLAHLSDQLLVLSERIQQLERKQNNNIDS
jgi:hypothetical protein